MKRYIKVRYVKMFWRHLTSRDGRDAKTVQQAVSCSLQSRSSGATCCRDAAPPLWSSNHHRIVSLTTLYRLQWVSQWSAGTSPQPGGEKEIRGGECCCCCLCNVTKRPVSHFKKYSTSLILVKRHLNNTILILAQALQMYAILKKICVGKMPTYFFYVW